ncbi:hypothetical protein D9757_001076 [Collybiopsis confluens]|uniref:Ubiquitin-like protease family profile domain-containing protein n=2 Tax=Collybiopsis confluens TaxID=2823264 RepID=A0A8H5MG55_9AGAR|nr:hypothetical protein D9757_001076 [Collybiopsis confluens]
MKPKQPPMNPFLEKYTDGYLLNKKHKPNGKDPPKEPRQSARKEPKNPFLPSPNYSLPIVSGPHRTPIPLSDRRRANEPKNPFLSRPSPSPSRQMPILQQRYPQRRPDYLSDEGSIKRRSVLHPLNFPFELADDYLKKLILGLKKDDLDRLNQNNLLNDTLIEVGLRYWLWDLSMRIPALGETVYVFNSFFYLQLGSSNPEESYTHVKNWTRKNKINVDIFSKDFIVIPIHEQSHWYLAIIHRPFLMLPYHLPTPASPIPHNAVAEETDVPQTTIYILDSLNGHHPKVAPRLSSYLQHEARERHNCSNISDAVECIVKVPQQPNSTDCGVYLLHFAETFVERYNSSFAEASTNEEDLISLY